MHLDGVSCSGQVGQVLQAVEEMRLNPAPGEVPAPLAPMHARY